MGGSPKPSVSSTPKLFVPLDCHSGLLLKVKFTVVCPLSCTPAVSALALTAVTPGASTLMPLYSAVAGVGVW